MNNYPRPQMKRDSFQSLDGEWMLNQSTINVPYPPQAPASGYTGDKDASHLSYCKYFDFKKEKARTILHFGAVDQLACVSLNGIQIGTHEGGYLPFEFDVTDAVVEGVNELTVECEDKLDHYYPYGKQTKKPGGMWYTPFSGIWKSVWLEQVPEEYIHGIKITPDLKGVTLDIDGEIQRIDIDDPHCWTPDDPYLYTRTVTKGEDSVEIYFALRTVEIKEIDGINRVCLNGKPVFLHGLLDQGYYVPGLVTATPEEYEKDILAMKSLGFNMLRKHIKIEDESFYYLCDKLGMLVMQDMVNNGEYKFFKDTLLATLGFNMKDTTGFDDKRKTFWIEHSKETMEHLYNHPSIIAYTLFNEGWGQFESDAAYTMLKSVDGTRLFDSTSGWFPQHRSDFDSVHIYFRTVELYPKERPLLLSEFGGYSYPVEGHRSTKKTYGYGACRSKDELTDKIVSAYEKMVIPAIKKGLCGSIYTQVSDIEDEINGMMTYDREVMKVDEEKIKELSERICAEIEKI